MPMPELRISSVLERDLDFLLLEEFVASPAFLSWFLAKIDLSSDGILLAAARSVSDETGESDLELTIQCGSSIARVLLENKIGARLQPRQAERYTERGANYVQTGACQSVTTVIVSPSGYVGSERLGFDKSVTYEAVLAWFESSRDLGFRSEFKRALLERALNPPTWTRTTDPVTTAFRHQYWLLAQSVAPELGVEAPGPVPASSFFVKFAMPSGVQFFHQIPYGRVDLQFAGMGDRLEEFTQRFTVALPPGASIRAAGKSAAITISVPQVAMDTPFHEAESDILLALDAAIRLRRWYFQASGNRA